eukprot:1807661-Alexandrium_andersonii.AAC.1
MPRHLVALTTARRFATYASAPTYTGYQSSSDVVQVPTLCAGGNESDHAAEHISQHMSLTRQCNAFRETRNPYSIRLDRKT